MIKCCATPFVAAVPCHKFIAYIGKSYIVHLHLRKDITQNIYLPVGNRHFCFFGRHKPFLFKRHNLRKELFILWGQLSVLLQKRNEHITPETQSFHLLSVVILALPFPLWDKRAVEGKAVIVKVLDMGN